MICLDLTSFDESADDDGQEVIKTHPLLWLSPLVNAFKWKLDNGIIKDKSAQSHRQRNEGMTGSPSSCAPPEDFPSWVFRKK